MTGAGRSGGWSVGAGLAAGAVARSGGWRWDAARRARRSGGGWESTAAGEGRETDEVVGGRDQVAGHPGALQAPVARPAEAADRFEPPEDLLDPRPDSLTDGVARVAGGSSVDRAG